MNKRSAHITKVQGQLASGKPQKAVFRKVEKDGRVVRLRVIDANGPDLTEQLTGAFRSSVRKARAENRALGKPAV